MHMYVCLRYTQNENIVFKIPRKSICPRQNDKYYWIYASTKNYKVIKYWEITIQNYKKGQTKVSKFTDVVNALATGGVWSVGVTRAMETTVYSSPTSVRANGMMRGRQFARRFLNSVDLLHWFNLEFAVKIICFWIEGLMTYQMVKSFFHFISPYDV